MQARSIAGTVAGLLALAFIVGIAGIAAAEVSGQEATPSAGLALGPGREVAAVRINARGQSYGSSMHADSLETVPDLIQVKATNGRVGYVLKEDLLGTAPGSRGTDSMLGRAVPVFRADGVTRVGVFIVSDQAASDVSGDGAALSE